MKVQLHIEPHCKESFASITAKSITPTLSTAISMLENEGEYTLLSAIQENKKFMLEPLNLQVVRTEASKVIVYNNEGERFEIKSTLNKLEEALGHSFVRISKSTLVNILSIHHVSASFNGTMELVLRNGIEEVITRNYRKSFKKRLGV